MNLYIVRKQDMSIFKLTNSKNGYAWQNIETNRSGVEYYPSILESIADLKEMYKRDEITDIQFFENDVEAKEHFNKD